MVIRLFRQEDAAQCSYIMKNHFLNYAVNLPAKVRTEIAQARTVEYVQDISNNRTIAVAEVKDNVVGMGALKENEIRHMYVLTDFQRMGIGAKILSFLEEIAQEKGYSLLVVNSVAHSEKFYIIGGFKTLKKTSIVRHGQKLEAVFLEKRIK